MSSLTTWAPFCAVVLPMWTMLSSKQSHGCSCQGCKATNSNHTGTLRNLPNLHQHAPELSRTLRNLARPSGTNLSQPSGTYLRNLRQHTLTLRNLPEPSGTCLRNLHHFTPNSPEPSGTCLRNLNQDTPEPSWTFRNPPPEPTPTHTGTLRNFPEPRLRNLHQHTPELSGTFRNLPEPSSGTCSCDPHRHTPELIWAEDPISLRCWGKSVFWSTHWKNVGSQRVWHSWRFDTTVTCVTCIVLLWYGFCAWQYAHLWECNKLLQLYMCLPGY